MKTAFLVPANTFDNVQGAFPIGFFVWDTGQPTADNEAMADCDSAKGEFLGHKRLCPVTRDGIINKWLHGFFDLLRSRRGKWGRRRRSGRIS